MKPETASASETGQSPQAPAAPLQALPVTEIFQWESLKTRVTLFTLHFFVFSGFLTRSNSKLFFVAESLA
ncbi:hypothetical protein [Propionivibrio sp.]|uniref:hypothetical protein n=1 Tax=Propionivibrio sp. TaxID=2212460 RepID=UPI003BF3EE39